MRAVIADVPKLPTVSSSHDCGSLSRVVMVRKTDHRMINHKKPEAVNTKSLNFEVETIDIKFILVAFPGSTM